MATPIIPAQAPNTTNGRIVNVALTGLMFRITWFFCLWHNNLLLCSMSVYFSPRPEPINPECSGILQYYSYSLQNRPSGSLAAINPEQCPIFGGQSVQIWAPLRWHHDSTNMVISKFPNSSSKQNILHKNKILKTARDPFQTVFDAEYYTQFLAMNWTFFSFQDCIKNNRVLQGNFKEEHTASPKYCRRQSKRTSSAVPIYGAAWKWGR